MTVAISAEGDVLTDLQRRGLIQLHDTASLTFPEGAKNPRKRPRSPGEWARLPGVMTPPRAGAKLSMSLPPIVAFGGATTTVPAPRQEVRS